MINGLCVIQEGQNPDRQRQKLTAVLNDFARERLGDSLAIDWLVVAEGCGFTAGRPSRSSVLSLTAGESLGQERREGILRDLVSLWTSETGCSIDEIVAVVADPAPH